MSSLPDGVIVMFAVASLVATVTHWKVSRYFAASAVSVLISPFVFLVVGIFQAGIPENLKPSDYLIFAAMSLPPALIIGLLFKIARTIKSNSRLPSNGGMPNRTTTKIYLTTK